MTLSSTDYLSKLSFDMETTTKKVYKNITKVKGKMVTVVDTKISLFIDGHKLDEHEIFLEDVYFNSLLYPGRYPMFTCTCRIFGCGGYHVEVVHTQDTLMWRMEQSPFMDKTIRGSNEFVFSWSNIIEFSGEWIERLENLQNLMLSHELKFQCDLEKYKSIVEEVKTMRC
ncbi:hypothetical protein ABIE27_003719 [Paenibacillus sp. 4624]|jgi:hypothetical protein|uniref:hypothetical protein n=1 Tax=Paenibacillus sp. 4624 TaxID=3156453 RepID=UPI003D1B53BE